MYNKTKQNKRTNKHTQTKTKTNIKQTQTNKHSTKTITKYTFTILYLSFPLNPRPNMPFFVTLLLKPRGLLPKIFVTKYPIPLYLLPIAMFLFYPLVPK